MLSLDYPQTATRLGLVICLLLTSMCLHRECSAEIVVDFESFDLSGETDGYLSGPAPNAVTVPPPDGAFGGEDQVGSFNSQGVMFENRFNGFGSHWGFAISNRTDTTTQSFENQASVFAGSGAGGSNQFAIAFGHQDLINNPFASYQQTAFDSKNVDHLRDLPSIYLPSGAMAVRTDVTNTTYAALTMTNGDAFAKKFGGASGDDPDFFKLSVFGIDSAGQAMDTEIEFYLADFRSADASQDDILDSWQTLDLTPLGGARSLHFNLVSSDGSANPNGFGMNTPAYFAMDNFTITSVPEPSSMLFLSSVGAGVFAWRRRRKGKQVSQASS